MPVNQSARPVRLLIGAEDFSNAFLEASSWQSTPLSSSGLITTTATFRLLNVRGLPSSLDDRINPTTWRTGQTVVISTTKLDGTFAVHPAGRLRILSSEFDDETQQLTINCGCLITLLSFRQSTDPAKSEIDIGTFTSRSTIVSKLLTAAGITSVSNPYSLPNPINYSISINESYLSTVGRLLYSSGFFAYVNSDEVFCIKPINLLGSGTLTLKIGGDDGEELWYKRLRGGEGPREIIKVVGTTKVAQPSGFPSVNTSTRYGDAITIDPNLSGLTVISNQTVDDDYINFVRTTKTTVVSPIGLNISGRIAKYSSAGAKLSLITGEYRVEKRQYESGKEGKLKSVYTELYRPIGAVLTEYYEYLISLDTPVPVFGLSSPFLSEIIQSEYFYDSKNRSTTIKTTKYESVGALLTGTDMDWSIYAGPPVGLNLAETSEESWKEERKGEWVHEIIAHKTLFRVKPGAAEEPPIPGAPIPDPDSIEYATLLSNKVANLLSLTVDDEASARETSNSGQQTPPAPEHCPPKAGFEDEQIKGEAHFSQLGGNPLQERERTFQIDYLEGKEVTAGTTIPATGGSPSGPVGQCEKIAQIEGQLLYGRFKGQDIGLNLRDELFNWEPLMRVNCVEPDGTNRAYALDDSHWFLGSERALCNFGCIHVGDVIGNVSPVTATAAGTTVVVTVK